jgi:hypothetical protein
MSSNCFELILILLYDNGIEAKKYKAKQAEALED